MDKQPPAAIFGLNFLQDMKGVPAEVAGAYDPEQELWTIQGQAQRALPGVKDDLVNFLVMYLEQNGLSPTPESNPCHDTPSE
jgi:hypothetical protein